MTKFRKKPVEIEAVQWTGNNLEEIKEFVGNSLRVRGSLVVIVTLEGEMIASNNDWIIKGVNGEFYPCKPDIFEKTYDEIKETTFIDRLIIERNDLQDKLNKLEIFFGTETFKNLSIEMKRLMRDQSSIMEDYITILGQRVKLLKS